jgi:hypothetical protein
MAILALARLLLGLRNWDLNLHSRRPTLHRHDVQEKLIEAELSPVYPIGETTGDFRNPPPGYKCPATSRIGLNGIDGSASSRRRP